jgi:E3 ubiquitin-protein ligase UBR4
MELILSEASKQPADIYNEFSSLCGDTEQLEFLLNNINGTFVRSHPNLLQALMRLIPFLSFGDEKKIRSSCQTAPIRTCFTWNAFVSS